MKSTHTEVVMDLLVERKDEVAAGVVSVRLADPAGGELPTWEPGAHIDLLLGPDLTRQYSLSGDPADRRHWRIGVLRELQSRGGSVFVHDSLQVGSLVTVRGPRNHFPLVPAPRYIFIAGGIGITPLLPMLASADERGAQWRFVYGGRTRNSMAFAAELRQYGDRVEFVPQDEYGLLDLSALLGKPRPDTAVYCCGPGPLLDAVEAQCAQWPAGALHVERFAPKPVTAAASLDRFEVELAQTGKMLTVPADCSILQVIRDAGVPILSSCEEGTCGTCETAVLAGVPDHRDSLLTPEERAENNTMFVCVSRSRTPVLVLDI